MELTCDKKYKKNPRTPAIYGLWARLALVRAEHLPDPPPPIPCSQWHSSSGVASREILLIKDS